MAKELPVYNIEDFKHFSSEGDFYANRLSAHVKQHQFVNSPHKHDFFLIVIFTKGSGTHEIDFQTYKIKPGALFILTPGQMHNWKLSMDVEGYVFFHSAAFYNEGYSRPDVHDYPFFHPMHNKPLIMLSGQICASFVDLFKEILKEYESTKLSYALKLHALLTIFYIELTRIYKPVVQNKEQVSYVAKLRKLETLIDRYFKEKKYPREYAGLMNMSEKHLTRICKTCLNKTATELIANRIILEAKRLLGSSLYNVTEVANELGFSDNSYFARFFKKHTGKSPLQFLRKYQ